MKERPLVSIITPSFNRRAYLQGCLDSVARQEYENVEHIVVDGGSSDGTVEFLESRRSDRLSFVSERDDGMYDAINKGLRLARGQIVAYLNTDDRYFPWSVGRAVQALARADIVFGDLCIVVKGTDSEHWYPQFYRDFEFDHYCRYMTIAQPTVFLRRSLYEAVGDFGGGFDLIADCDYWLRCANAGARFDKIPDVLALQIDHGETLRATHHTKLQDEFRLLVAKHQPGLEIPSQGAKRARQAIYARLRKASLLGSLLAGGASSPGGARFVGQLRAALARPTISDVCSALGKGARRSSFISSISPTQLERWTVAEGP